jgi:transcriptional regulator with XRE-family HTH domain
VHAIESGLKRILKGEDCSHKFSDEVIEQMKKDATTKSYTQKEIAEKYNISQSHLSSILKGNYRGEGVSEKAIRKITGEKVHNATSTDEEIYQIKGMLANNVPRSVIAKQFNISKTKVQQIATGEYWGHIVHPNYTYVPKPKGMKFTKDDAKQVLILKEKGLTIRDISSKMNMSWSMVNNICGGKMWKEVKEEFEKERG